MKICWDNLEGVYFTKNGCLVRNQTWYIEKSACNECGESYLTPKKNPSCFCSVSCAQKNRSPMSEITKKKIGLANIGKIVSKETRKKLSIAKKNESKETRRKKSLSQMGEKNHRFGKPAYNNKGDVKKKNLPLYDTYAIQISYVEDVRRFPENDKLLQVRCAYCGKWFVPKCSDVKNRIGVLNGVQTGEGRLYCSENCKLACPTYHKQKYPKGFKHVSSREVNPYLRQMVLERDNWTCQICGKTSKEAQLHVHHMDPVAQNLMFQNDMDSRITLCKKCHKMVHSRIGCRYIDLRCKEGGGA